MVEPLETLSRVNSPFGSPRIRFSACATIIWNKVVLQFPHGTRVVGNMAICLLQMWGSPQLWEGYMSSNPLLLNKLKPTSVKLEVNKVHYSVNCDHSCEAIYESNKLTKSFSILCRWWYIKVSHFTPHYVVLPSSLLTYCCKMSHSFVCVCRLHAHTLSAYYRTSVCFSCT